MCVASLLTDILLFAKTAIFYSEAMPASKKGKIPAQLHEAIVREMKEFDAFRQENSFPSEAEVLTWLKRECNENTASRNMLGLPWLQTYGFSAVDIRLLQYDLLVKLWDVGLQPFDEVKRLEVRAVGEALNEIGGNKAMLFNYVVLQGMVNGGGALLGGKSERPAGVLALCPSISARWSGVGDWMH